MADRSSDSGAVYLGFAFAVDTEREREGELSEGREERVGYLIQAREGSGWTELCTRGGGSTAAVATARGRGRRG
jgi:hypothetical protein